MPYKTEKLALNDPFLKRSCKLLPCQKEMVLHWHSMGYSQRSIASVFQVSKRLIQFIIDPEKHAENLQRRKERGGSTIYYNRLKNNEAMKDHRKYKHELLK
jgi:hypothetical protein